MPKRFGPTRLGPPFSKVWQVWQTFAAAWPFSTDAVCSSFSIGSLGAAAGLASSPLPPSSLAAISNPGLAIGFGVNIALAVKLVISNTRQVASTAPRILLISKESIFGSGSRPEGRGGPHRAAVEGKPRKQAFAAHPETA